LILSRAIISRRFPLFVSLGERARIRCVLP
jgi:hypothetical protein